MKPLIVIYIDSEIYNKDFVETARNGLRKTGILKEYFVLIIPRKETEVKVFFDKDVEEIKIEEFQKEILLCLQKDQNSD